MTHHADPEDSLVLADKMAGIVGYHIFQKYDYMEMEEVMSSSDSGNMVCSASLINLYENL